jgi:membrane-associated phospholipid phosphatase
VHPEHQPRQQHRRHQHRAEAACDRARRDEWLRACAAVAFAHGVSIGVKRVIRRPRPDDPSVRVLVSTPGRLSFPSSHACSTTAAALAYGALLDSHPTRGARRLGTVLVPPMLLSRLVLGVHFPSDVLAGSALGAAVAALAARRGRTGRVARPGRAEPSRTDRR